MVMPGGGDAVDASELITDLTWGGRNGSPTRTLDAVLLDHEGPGYERLDIDPERGDQCILAYIDDDKKTTELFRGLIMYKGHTSDNRLTFRAYDLGIYLSNNKDTFVYSNKTATEIFNDVCSRFGIPIGETAATSYTIAEMTSSKTTGWDTIADAIEQTYENTGVRYAVVAKEGKLNLYERRKNVLQYLLDLNRNISQYESSVSIENIRTRLKAYDKEDTVVAEAVDSDLEAKIGMFQDIETADDEMTQAQVASMVQTDLSKVNTPEKSLTVTCLGIPDVIAGMGVFVRISDLEIKDSYYVEEDQHSYSAGSVYTMQLSLTLAEDTQESPPQENPSSFEVGDEVNFSGGSHYVSSDASKPAGGTRSAGTAKITNVAKGNAHPYHLIGKSSNVYGWVDAGTFTKG